MSAASINMHVAVGALSIGSSVNFMLLALELTQVYRYYRSYYERDPFFLKIVVATAVLLDCFQSATIASCVYGYTITHFGDYNNLLKQGFEIPVYLAVTGIVGGICQGYLTWRLFKLSKNWILVGIVTLIVIAGTACAVLTAVFIVKYAEYSQRHTVVIPVTIWLTCEAAGDVLLAVSLIGFLFAYRSKTDFDRTRSLLQRLILMSAQSGSVTSIVALIALCIYLSDNEGNVSVGIAFCLGRLYTLTMLLNLNIRGAGNVQAGSSSGAGKTTTFAYPLGQTRMGRENAAQEETMHAITVQHDVNIHIDDERDDFTAEKRSVPVMFVNDQRETSDLEFDGESQKSMSKVGAYLPGQ